jgi:hypothetical protein
LFADIENCTRVLGIIPKYSADTMVPDQSRLTLLEARSQLLSGQLRGLQIRYHYSGADWWDTLMVADSAFRIVRIRHDFS